MTFGEDDSVVLIDTNILNFFLEAMESGDLPPTRDSNVRAEQVATFRLFLWTEFGIGRVATDEVQQHPHEARRERLQRVINTQLPEYWVQEDEVDRWKSRATELEQHHSGESDCRLVSEAEIVGASTLLSFDKRMVRNLRSHAKVRLLFPTELDRPCHTSWHAAQMDSCP